MVCAQDEKLLKRGISIDHFKKVPNTVIKYFFVTHAHHDHMRGLTNNFFKKNGKIYCSEVTKELIRIMYPKISSSSFVTLVEDQWAYVTDNVMVRCFNSHHSPGSFMYLFDVCGERILYTGDFRFVPEMQSYTMLKDELVNKMYYDDTFDEIEEKLPTYDETLDDLSNFLKTEREKYDVIYIHTGILGVEMILEKLAEQDGISYNIDENLRKTWRGKQLLYLLDRYIVDEPCQIVLGNYKNFKKNNEQASMWIILTTTHFICKTKSDNKLKPEYIFFASHSNKQENYDFRYMVKALEVNPCFDNIDINGMKCNK